MTTDPGVGGSDGALTRRSTLRDLARWVAAGAVVLGTAAAARVGTGRLCFKPDGCPDCPAFAGCGRPKSEMWRRRQKQEAV